MLRNHDAQQVERKIFIQINLLSAFAADKADIGVPLVLEEFVFILSLQVNALAAESICGKGEHQGRFHLVHHLESRVVFLATIMLVHNAEMVIVPLVESGIYYRSPYRVASLNAMVIAKHQAVHLHDLILHLSVQYDLTFDHLAPCYINSIYITVANTTG